jgi:CRISPR-associated endonuclease/helicase Cas3
MVSEITSPDNLLQRLGRLNRFSENPHSKYIIAIDNNFKSSNSKNFLRTSFVANTVDAFHTFLIEKLAIKSKLELVEIYSLYNEFHTLDYALDAMKTDLLLSLSKSVRDIDGKILDPIDITMFKTEKSKRLAKNSLRNNSRYKQVAVCEVSPYGVINFTNQYAYDDGEESGLTASIEEIEGNKDSNKNLLSHMMKKHHRIFKCKKSYKDFILLNKARDREFPIYLSYTPEHLDMLSGESDRHEEAVYYAICDKQPIGLMKV